MNAVMMNRTSLKVTVCGAMALALTWASGWAFVESAAVVKVAATPVQMVANASQASAHLAQTAATGLLQ